MIKISPINILYKKNQITFHKKSNNCHNSTNNTHYKPIYYSTISFGAKKTNMKPQEDKNRDLIATIIAEYDFEDIANKLIKDKVVSTPSFLIDFYKDDEKQTKVHFAISEGAFSDKFAHYHYSIEDFKDIMTRVCKKTSEEYPEYKTSYAQCLKNLMDTDSEH